MDRYIKITSEFKTMGVTWHTWTDEQIGLYVERVGQLNSEDEWRKATDEDMEDFEQFLDNLENIYDFEYMSTSNDTEITLPRNSVSFSSLIELIVEIARFLEERNIPWYINNLKFDFNDEKSGGIITVNDKKQIIVYYLDPKNNKFHKKKFGYGKTRKLK